MPTETHAPASGPPTRVRYGVLGFACALSMITYLDRVCFGSAASDVIRDLDLKSEAALGWVFTAFAFAYAAFEVPSGWLGDVFGPRRTLIRIVIWWSVFTAITGLVGLRVGAYALGGLATLTVVRFLFGMGEAGAYPNITRALHNWFPYQERGFTQGMVWMSGRLMGGLTPLVWTVLISGIVSEGGKWSTPPLLNWRSAFWVFGVVGLVWCAAFAWWFRNRPEEKPTVNAAELAYIRAGGAGEQAGHEGVPWRKLFTSHNLWALCLMYACGAFGWYFTITYLPRFMEQHHLVKPTSLLGAAYKGGPLWMGAIGCLAGGVFTDWFIRRTGNRRLGRRLLGIAGHGLCAACYLSCIFMETPFTFFLAISLAMFFNDLTMGSAWATCQDIGGRYAAIVAGCMNTVGNMGGALSGWATGTLLERSLSDRAAELNVTVDQLTPTDMLAAKLTGYEINFVIFAAVYVVAILCWLRIDATEPVVPEGEAAHH
jgi:MFS transporter, ACS family, glucarate transporter